ncbi:sterol desaturase family protein [bacterium]|nr:MAG: sterol desaturase family protein [bacterium]
MPKQYYTTGIVILSAVVFVILERLFPYKKDEKVFRDGFFIDLIFYTIVQSYVLGLLIFGSLNYLYANFNLSHYRLLDGAPVWMQLLFFFVVHDFYIYWFHRWQHHNKYLWRVHEAHHSPRSVDWLSGSRSHSLEIIINQTIEFGPIILLGAAPEVALYKGLIDAVWGMFIHSNLDVRLRWLQYFINGPEMHRWHHSDDEGQEYKNNYSTKLAIWDWIFGTAFYPDPGIRKPDKYGLSDTPEYPIFYNKRISEVKEKLKGTGIISYGIIYFIKLVYLNTIEYIMQHLFIFRSFKAGDRIG